MDGMDDAAMDGMDDSEMDGMDDAGDWGMVAKVGAAGTGD